MSKHPDTPRIREIRDCKHEEKACRLWLHWILISAFTVHVEDQKCEPFSTLTKGQSWHWALGFDFFDKKDLDFGTTEYC